MKTQNLLISLLFALSYANSAHANIHVNNKNCPSKTETSAYIDHKEPVIPGLEVGDIYKAYMKRILALEKTGDFKNFKIISQNMDIQPSYDSSTIPTLLLRVTINFDLNYDAVSTIYNQFKKSTINVSTYEIKNCR